MNANLVNILTWTNPTKTAFVLVCANVFLWVCTRQRPLYIIPMLALGYYIRKLWRQRLRGQILIDPPDHEDWVTLGTYDLQNTAHVFLLNLLNAWTNFRKQHHFLWTVATCSVWVVLAKLGMEVDCFKVLFTILNGAFFILPFLDYVQKHVDLNEYVSSQSTGVVDASVSVQEECSVKSQDDGGSQAFPSDISSILESLVTKSITATAVTLVTSTASAFQSTILSSPEVQDSGGPESLTPNMSQMPDHEEVDSEPEDEFLFDAKHFDKSSSSSISTSFEIIDDDL